MGKIVEYTKNAVKIFNIVIHRGVRAYTGCGEIVDGYKEISQAIGDMQNESRNKKINDFIMGIKACNEELSINDEDFLHIIRQLAKDDESSKTEYYSKLTIALASSEMDRSERAFYINTLGSLTRYEIDFAKKYYIYSKYNILGYETMCDQTKSLIQTDDGIALKAINKMISCGLVFEQTKNDADNKNTPFYMGTAHLEKLMLHIYSHGDLLPASIGVSKKESYDVVIIDSDNIKFNDALTSKLNIRHKKYIFIRGYELVDICPSSRLYISMQFSTYYSNGVARKNVAVYCDTSIYKVNSDERDCVHNVACDAVNINSINDMNIIRAMSSVNYALDSLYISR